MAAEASSIDQERWRTFTHKISRLTVTGFSHLEFLREVAGAVAEFSGCDAPSLMVRNGDSLVVCEALRHADESAGFDVACRRRNIDEAYPGTGDEAGLQTLTMDVFHGRLDLSLPGATPEGSFWTADVKGAKSRRGAGKTEFPYRLADCGYRSLALIPLRLAQENVGLLRLMCLGPGAFNAGMVSQWEIMAPTLTYAITDQRAQWALRERVKELTCLYGIAKLAEQPGISLDEILQGIVNLLPPGWQYPEITFGRVLLDGREFATPGFVEGPFRQSADIVVGRLRRGVLQVVYSRERPELDEGPFLREERNLIDAIARQVALIVERKEAEAERDRLQEQLRHADRLATIGQLAAGVAHELNEPLGGILGFAQLTRKTPDLPPQVQQDLDKIISGALYAREIVRKLLLFARQVPPKKTALDINRIAVEALSFFESRCVKENIQLVRDLAGDLPEITADPALLNQVLVNLVVNAIQAMPEGGTLTVRTRAEGDSVALVVEDTGVGMSEEILSQIFLPFFTTKAATRGTGIGLSVVHGIVTSHGGRVNVASRPGAGTRFEVLLPVRGNQEDEA